MDPGAHRRHCVVFEMYRARVRPQCTCTTFRHRGLCSHVTALVLGRGDVVILPEQHNLLGKLRAWMEADPTFVERLDADLGRQIAYGRILKDGEFERLKWLVDGSRKRV